MFYITVCYLAFCYSFGFCKVKQIYNECLNRIKSDAKIYYENFYGVLLHRAYIDGGINILDVITVECLYDKDDKQSYLDLLRQQSLLAFATSIFWVPFYLFSKPIKIMKKNSSELLEFATKIFEVKQTKTIEELEKELEEAIKNAKKSDSTESAEG